MKDYLKPTGGKILGVIILIALFSMLWIMPYFSDPVKFLNDLRIPIGWPLIFLTVGGTESFNIVNLVIGIVIFYLTICFISFVFKGRKDKNVPNSNSAGGNTSPSGQTQPGN